MRPPGHSCPTVRRIRALNFHPGTPRVLVAPGPGGHCPQEPTGAPGHTRPLHHSLRGGPEQRRCPRAGRGAVASGSGSGISQGQDLDPQGRQGTGEGPQSPEGRAGCPGRDPETSTPRHRCHGDCDKGQPRGLPGGVHFPGCPLAMTAALPGGNDPIVAPGCRCRNRGSRNSWTLTQRGRWPPVPGHSPRQPGDELTSVLQVGN